METVKLSDNTEVTRDDVINNTDDEWFVGWFKDDNESEVISDVVWATLMQN